MYTVLYSIRQFTLFISKVLVLLSTIEVYIYTAHMHSNTHTRMCVSVCMCICVCMRACMYVCMCVNQYYLYKQ